VARAGYRFAYTACEHQDAAHPELTIQRLLLWEGSSIGGNGRFSPAILDCQTHRLWPPARRCERVHAGMTAMLTRLYQRLGQDGVSRAALLLVAGRTVGFVAAFAIPVVLARTFDQAAFGTYKQLFLIYATFYGLAQLGAAESLYYFVPRSADEAGRRVANALVTLSLTGIACFAGLYLGRFANRRVSCRTRRWRRNCRCSACFWRSC
jgi:hypothetical protein